MIISLTKKINSNTQIRIDLDDEKDMKEAFLKLTPFMQMSGVCGLCQSEVSIQARKTRDKDGDEYIYLELYCKKCHARQNFGEYKQPKGALFLKKWEKYEPKSNNIQEAPADEEDL
jgi:hypothetical protein